MEDYPQSPPQSSQPPRSRVELLQTPATATIKVSLDEAVVLDRRSGAELMTDGLSGCVAIGLKSDSRIGLTHVYSDALDRFPDYRESIRAFAQEVANGGGITEAYIVHNGNARDDRHPQTLPEMLRQCLTEQGLVRPGGFTEKACNGCTLSENGLFLKDGDNPAVYGSGGHTNGALAQLDGERASSLRAHVVRTGDLFPHGTVGARSGFGGHSDVPAVPIAAMAHRVEAYVVPPLPPKAAVDVSALPLDESVRRQLGTLGLLKFGELRPATRAVTEVLQSQGMTEARVEHSPGEAAFRVLGNGQSVTFEVADGKVKRAAEPSLPTSQAASSVPVEPDAKPRTLFEQAVSALEPHRATLRLQTSDQLNDAAREVASLARHDGLSGISQLTPGITPGGEPALVAHQDGASARQSQPMAVDAVQRQAGVETPSQGPAQGGPDKHHFPIM